MASKSSWLWTCKNCLSKEAGRNCLFWGNPNHYLTKIEKEKKSTFFGWVISDKSDSLKLEKKEKKKIATIKMTNGIVITFIKVVCGKFQGNPTGFCHQSFLVSILSSGFVVGCLRLWLGCVKCSISWPSCALGLERCWKGLRAGVLRQMQHVPPPLDNPKEPALGYFPWWL